jgi:hypothetical protein
MSLVTLKKVRRRTREKCHLAEIGKYFPVIGCYNIFSVLQKGETSEMLCVSGSIPWDSGWTFICQWVALLLLFGMAVKVSAEGDGLVHEHEVGGSCCKDPRFYTRAFGSRILLLPNTESTRLSWFWKTKRGAFAREQKYLNPLKLSGYYMNHLFQITNTLHSAYTVYLCVPYGSHNKQPLFP